jgi:hypothetical protein
MAVLEKVIVTQLVKNFPAMYGMFITIFTRAHYAIPRAYVMFFK